MFGAGKGKNYSKILLVISGLSVFMFQSQVSHGQKNTMRISMNLDTPTYWSDDVIFTDLARTGSALVPYHIFSNDWDDYSVKNDDIPVTESGLPPNLPFTHNDKSYAVRILFQNRKGEYVFSYDGKGELKFNNAKVISKKPNKIRFRLKGEGNFWVNFMESDKNDPIRNLKILPIDPDTDEVDNSTFTEEYLTGLRPFDALRFYRWQDCDRGRERRWEDRKTANSYAQGSYASVELAVQLANELSKDAWLCVPYAADDDYIRNMAEFVRNTLHKDLKVYIEYSNELWNWIFPAAHYVLNNGQDSERPWLNAAPEITGDLKQIGDKFCGGEGCHPEKDAYMMARVFRIWEDVFRDERGRLVTVAAGQQGWPDNSDRILQYLTEETEVTVDAFTTGGYFWFGKEDHERWLEAGNVTVDQILDVAEKDIQTFGRRLAKKNAEILAKYKVDFLVYEGGQHLQPHNQEDWPYNEVVWDSQIHPRMYDLYIQNLNLYQEMGVKNFFAYRYLGERKSKFGSWGHLETLNDLKGDVMKNAPKYKALVDFAEGR